MASLRGRLKLRNPRLMERYEQLTKLETDPERKSEMLENIHRVRKEVEKEAQSPVEVPPVTVKTEPEAPAVPIPNENNDPINVPGPKS